MKRIFALTTILVLFIVSCGKADVVIRTDLENTRSSVYTIPIEETAETAATDENGLMIFVVNSSSKTFHISDACRYAKNISSKNKTYIHEGDAARMIELGYKPCSVCIGDMTEEP